MKRLLIALFVVICCHAPAVFSLEFTLIEGVGNLAYNEENTTPLSEGIPVPPPGTFIYGTFTPSFYPLILARISGDIAGGLSFNVGFNRSPIMRNRLFANIRFDHNYFFLEAGPVLGLLNSSKLPVNPGLSATVRAMLPGIIYLEASGSSTLAAIPMEKKGRYSQVSADLSFGFWVPHVICSFNMSIENYNLRKETNFLIEDKSQRYFFRADVFTKNFPYTVKVDMGFQRIMRSYSLITGTDIDTVTDEFRSIFAGMEGVFTINPSLKLLVGAEIPVYSWSVRPMNDPEKKTFFFNARLGIIWTLTGKNKESVSADE